MSWLSKVKRVLKPKTEDDLKSLVTACVDNQRWAQEQLYRSYFDIAYSTCRKHTNDEEKIIEICNNSFLKVFKNLHNFGFEGSFEGWIKRITFNCLSDYFRKDNRQPRFMQIESVDDNYEADQMNSLLEADLLHLVENLPDKQRQVFLYYAVEGYSHKEISKMVGIAEGTSKWQLSEARKNLIIQLAKQDDPKRSSSI